MLTARSVMENAGVLLLDQDHIRWPLVELANWINEGVRAIVLAKPSASSKSVNLLLQIGTLQLLPSGTAPEILALLGINRNLLDAATPPKGGRMIRTTSRALLDSQEPRWHDPLYVPFRQEVRQVIYDENVPREFYVYPGNDGTGRVEAAVSFLPPPVAATGDNDPEDIASWDIAVGLAEPYSVPLLDYVLYRCHIKDDTAANAGRGMTHYQAFAAAVGLKVQVEETANPNRRR